ncbi:PIN domain-containing protein [Streptomyces yangpuensis]
MTVEPWYRTARDAVWTGTEALQRQLADAGAHQCASPVDLLVAVIAQQHGLTVLHQDADFETIAKVTGQPVRRILG